MQPYARASPYSIFSFQNHPCFKDFICGAKKTWYRRSTCSKYWVYGKAKQVRKFCQSLLQDVHFSTRTNLCRSTYVLAVIYHGAHFGLLFRKERPPIPDEESVTIYRESWVLFCTSLNANNVDIFVNGIDCVLANHRTRRKNFPNWNRLKMYDRILSQRSFEAFDFQLLYWKCGSSVETILSLPLMTEWYMLRSICWEVQRSSSTECAQRQRHQ